MHPFLCAYVHLCIVTSIKYHYVSLQIASSLYFTTFPTFQVSNTKFCFWLNLLLSKFITIILTTMTSLRFESFIFYLSFFHIFLQCILFIFFHFSRWLPYSYLLTISAKCHILPISKKKKQPKQHQQQNTYKNKTKQSMQKQKYTDIIWFVFVKKYWPYGLPSSILYPVQWYYSLVHIWISPIVPIGLEDTMQIIKREISIITQLLTLWFRMLSCLKNKLGQWWHKVSASNQLISHISHIAKFNS